MINHLVFYTQDTINLPAFAVVNGIVMSIGEQDLLTPYGYAFDVTIARFNTLHTALKRNRKALIPNVLKSTWMNIGGIVLASEQGLSLVGQAGVSPMLFTLPQPQKVMVMTAGSGSKFSHLVRNCESVEEAIDTLKDFVPGLETQRISLKYGSAWEHPPSACLMELLFSEEAIEKRHY